MLRLPSKTIPKMLMIPRRISFDFLVRGMLSGFQTYGDVFQLKVPFSVNFYCLRNPNHIRAVSMHKDSATLKAPGMMDKADYFMGNGLFNDLGGASWMAKRRPLSPFFTEAGVVKMLERLPECIDRMLARWKTIGSERPTELFHEFNRFVLDFGASAYFSKRYSTEELDWIVPATLFTEKMFASLAPNWIPTPWNIKYRRTKKRYREIFSGIIRERRKSGDPYPDPLRALLDQPNAETGKPHTDEEILAQMMSLNFGTPALGTAIFWSVFIMSARPEMLAKIRSELASVVGNRLPQVEDLPRLPYLDMFIKEVLRTYPSFWGSLRYCKDPIEFEGYTFPAKSMFTMVRWAAQRHPDHWENPDEFNPDRHLQKQACPHAYLPFGLGPRICLGRPLVSIVAPLTVATIAQNFDLEIASREPEVYFGFGVYPAKDVFANIRPRPISG